MAARVETRSAGAEAPVCQVTCIHTGVVEGLRGALDRTAGAAGLFKALADETRLKVVLGLSRAELCVCDVAALIDGSKATASYHLRLLYHLGLATYRREGKLVYYRLKDPRVAELLQAALQLEDERK